MNKCYKCGAELSEKAFFCKKCGTPIEKKRDKEVSNGALDELQNLSLEMRRNCDQMITVYVSEMKKLEVDKKSILEESQKEILDLKEKIIAREKELEVVKEKLNSCEEELENVKIELGLLEKLQMSKEQVNDFADGKKDKNKYCYGCGELITEEMMFCGTCGMRLK